MSKILIIDKDVEICKTLNNLFIKEGYDVCVANTGKEGILKVKEENPDIIILEPKLSDMDGISLIKEHLPTVENKSIIILTEYGNVDMAVQSMKLGVFDYIIKPPEEKKLLLSIKNALETKLLRQKVKDLSDQFYVACKAYFFIGNDPSIKRILEMAKKVASTDVTILIEGESGVGKEQIARLIHAHSLRKDKPFIAIDCGTFPDSLIESEFFGYEKGAFTGADKRKPGQFEIAEGGTVFLNEISNLPLSAQQKLLRVLQEREIQHLGGTKTIKIDVRILSDSNVSLEKRVLNKEFREDLYHRLNEFKIIVPPLRERGDDIFLLSNYFLEEANKGFYKEVKGFSDEVKELFLLYHWPGNVRELKSTVKRSVLLADDVIMSEHLPPAIQLLQNMINTTKTTDIKSEEKEEIIYRHGFKKKGLLMESERRVIIDLLKKFNNNRSKAAKELGITRRALYYK